MIFDLLMVFGVLIIGILVGVSAVLIWIWYGMKKERTINHPTKENWKKYT